MKQYIKKTLFFSSVFATFGLGLFFGQIFSENFLAAPFAQAKNTDAPEKNNHEYIELFVRIMHYIKTNYVDEISDKKLIEGAIRGMLEGLDPHSHLLNAEEFKDMQIDTSGKFGGLGIEIRMINNYITILAPIEDTPAWKAGLKPMDKIIKINGESTFSMTQAEAVNKMRGKPKTPITITIARKVGNIEKIIDVKIIRDIIKIKAAKSELLAPEIGYARLTTFNERASSDLKNAIQELIKKHKMKKLILDLRMNPGGLLDQAVEVASLFLKEGIVVSTTPRNVAQKEVRYVQKGMNFDYFPMVVLVDATTASAAEIVAGALKDHNRAIILGQPTFGKGSVQTVSPVLSSALPDMGLKMTIARYYTPSGTSIQETGVHPHILLDRYDTKLFNQAKIKFEMPREKDIKGHMVNPQNSDSKNDSDSNAKDAQKDTAKSEKDDEELSPTQFNPKEDSQVKEAMNILSGMEVMLKIEQSKANFL